MSPVRSRSFAPLLLSSAARIGVIGFAVLGAGCASQQAQTAYPGERLGGPPQRVASAQPKIEIEDDGLPAQIAPRHRRPVKDDTSEPWSPNYGKDAPTPEPAQPAPAKSARAMLPLIPPQHVTAAPRNGTSIRLSAVEEDEIVRRAVAAHEMRQR